jgi:hypothetical protein
VSTPMRRCSKCKQEFPATPEYFHWALKSEGKLHPDCKACKKAAREELRQRQLIDCPTDDMVTCALCGLVCKNQISASHIQEKHNMTTVEYKALGYDTLSPNRRNKVAQHFKIAEIKRNYGADHHNFKGGHINSSGYRVISRLGKHNLLEHRVIAEQKIGRPLQKGEVVHHVDGNRLNNHPDNLQVMTQAEHGRLENRKGGGRRMHNIAPETIQAARDLYKLGWSKSDIARALRIDPGAISRWVSEVI